MSLMKEFKTFAMRGNVIDLAVGVVIGAAFGKIVSSLVDKIIMPLLGLTTGGVDFSEQELVLRAAYGENPAITLGYGAFTQSVIDFVIIAFCIFMVIKGINKLMPPAPKPAPKNAPSQEQLLMEIRDLLAKGNKAKK